MESKIQNTKICSVSGNPTEDELMAIATAINLYYRGGFETQKLTIKHNHSTEWNSKTFGINKLPK